MGGGIAQVVAGSGRRVSLYDAAPGAVERGLETMRKSLGRLAEKGGPDPDEALGRIEPVEDPGPADLMIAAGSEAASLKAQAFPRAAWSPAPRAYLSAHPPRSPLSDL